MTSKSYPEPIIRPSPILKGITYVEWTLSCIEEETYQDLCGYKIYEERHGGKVTIYPYRSRAEQIMYQIPVYEPRPEFVISWPTLSQEVRSHLEVFEDTEFEGIVWNAILNAVGRIFENINARYYHQAVRKYLKVRIVK